MTGHFLDVIASEPRLYYMIDGVKIFHDEAKVWATVLNATPLNSNNAEEHAEWYVWWQTNIDATVVPGSFDKGPAFTLAQATLKPRFDKMNKTQLAEWIVKNTGIKLTVSTVYHSGNKSDLLNWAETAWAEGHR